MAGATVRAFPVHPEDIQVDWLNDALGGAGCLGEARITSFEMTVIGEGVGLLGRLVRLTPTYDRDDAGLPKTIIGKFATESAETRQVVAMYGFYAAEVDMYRHLADAVSLRTARCYFAAISDDGSEFVLLLEDMAASGRMGDQIAGCTVAEAKIAVEHLGTLHATWWGSSKLDGMPWLRPGLELGKTAFGQAYPVGWEPCLALYGHLFSPAIRDAAPTLGARILTLMDDLYATPNTIVHGDYRLDNIFFGGADSGYELAVIDWQLSNRGIGPVDVMYFIGTNLDTEVRRRCEVDLLRAYHARLLERGVADYPWERLWEDYRGAMAAYLGVLIGNVTSIDPTNERGAALFEMMLSRIATAVDDLDALETLPG